MINMKKALRNVAGGLVLNKVLNKVREEKPEQITGRRITKDTDIYRESKAWLTEEFRQRALDSGCWTMEN